MFNGKMAQRILFQSKFFPKTNTVYHCERDCCTKLRDGKTLIDVSKAVLGVTHRPNRERFEEITATDDLSCSLAITYPVLSVEMKIYQIPSHIKFSCLGFQLSLALIELWLRFSEVSLLY
jgi:hypothetical protein